MTYVITSREIRNRINEIFYNASKLAENGDYEAMLRERNKLKEMLRDGVINREIIRDFDGTMLYFYNKSQKSK